MGVLVVFEHLHQKSTPVFEYHHVVNDLQLWCKIFKCHAIFWTTFRCMHILSNVVLLFYTQMSCYNRGALYCYNVFICVLKFYPTSFKILQHLKVDHEII